VLDEIVNRKRLDVARRMEEVPFSDLKARTEPTTRSFSKALKKPGFRFVMECKKASPSEGLIRKNFDITEIAGVYNNFADAVSILTDEPYFQGSLDVLRTARPLLDRPILAKDFVLEPYQICEARSCGADAALLILSILDDAAYKICAAEAERLSMDVLTEVHNEEELERALRLNARIIGINNRNLKTLKVDLNVYNHLARKIPSDRLVVCESGIQSHEDVLRFGNAFPGERTHVFLVGGSLMKSERLDLAVRELVCGRVKVCGLTCPEDAAAAWKTGAVFGGMIFADSPRRTDPERAREIRAASPLPAVGVFVNEPAQNVARLASELDLAAVQLHGEETESCIGELRRKLPDRCEIWKAVRVRDRMPNCTSNLKGLHADRLLYDAFDKTNAEARGGTGRSFDWSLLEGDSDRSRDILAGGLNGDNIRGASRLGYFALDVNSGVESAPGKKDHQKITQLFANLRGDV
jgi:indole-3-glycerol phosphate synthase/phosphoribosylanthranilate isomerase